MSFGKLRISWGSTGSDQIGDYQYLNLYNSITEINNYQGVVAIFPGNLSNPYLQWEKTQKFQIGINLGIFKDRVLIDGTYSLNKSSNQLNRFPLPSTVGFNDITSNFPRNSSKIRLGKF